MEVFATWHGGSSYTAPDVDDRERFPSLKAASEALVDRKDNGGWRQMPFRKVGATETTWALTPVVDESSYMDLYATPDSEEFFARLEFGPRGGVQRRQQ